VVYPDPVTTPPQDNKLPIADPGNPLLAKVPALLGTGLIDSPEGQLAVLTIRDASTTFTVMLTTDELGNWLRQLQTLHGSMSRNGLIVVPPGALGQMRPK
jgi:hypothetical protein